MIELILALAASPINPDPKVAEAVRRWNHAIQSVDHDEPGPDADLKAKIRYLIRRDEITRQHLWLVDDRGLDETQRQAVTEVIGASLIEIDRQNTETLRKLLPASGWFTNTTHGKQITHGAWLIAQHSPEDAFREYALSKMAELVESGEVDARDYALTFDRVQIHHGKPQRYASQARCRDGRFVLQPIENPAVVNDARAQIGWAQTVEETMGDLQIGKPCD
jgi:hypothetical protein